MQLVQAEDGLMTACSAPLRSVPSVPVQQRQGSIVARPTVDPGQGRVGSMKWRGCRGWLLPNG